MINAERERSSAAPIVKLNGLSFAYKENEPVLRSIDLEITEGSIVLIIGKSGGGKTTLLKLIKGLLAPQQGEIRLFGEQPQKKQRSCGPHIAYIPQNLGLVRNLSVETNVLTGALSRVNPLLSLLRIFPKNIRLQARTMLKDLGIADKASEKVQNLSGGQRQRVAIGRALMEQAELILADEFVSQLDPVTTLEIMAIVRKLAQKGITFIIATHEPSALRQYAQRVIILTDGKKVWDAAAEQTPNNKQLMALMK